MSVKQQSVAMPMSSAGIMGFSSDVKTRGIEIEPKYLIIAIVLIVLVVQIAGFLV